MGEFYGFDLAALSPEKIRRFSKVDHNEVPCPFKPQGSSRSRPKCSKSGGMCSLRRYQKNEDNPAETLGSPITVCPTRFLEDGLVFRWVGETLLGTRSPIVIPQLPFLMSHQEAGKGDHPEAVGMIDSVLVNPDTSASFRWCALEMQAVYFSGAGMRDDLKTMSTWKGPGIPFPSGYRHPDFRSSGPKRLMPQLQVKVPTISRWGKKMAVVTDEDFWRSLGLMRETSDLSNSEVVWFVVSYGNSGDGRFVLKKGEIHLTTLTHAVEGLTGGTPMPLERFESEIRARMPHAEAS